MTTDTNKDELGLGIPNRVICTTTWPLLSDYGLSAETGIPRDELQAAAPGTTVLVRGWPFVKEPDGPRGHLWRGPAQPCRADPRQSQPED
jgi:hypothetical protein